MVVHLAAMRTSTLEKLAFNYYCQVNSKKLMMKFCFPYGSKEVSGGSVVSLIPDTE